MWTQAVCGSESSETKREPGGQELVAGELAWQLDQPPSVADKLRMIDTDEGS